MNTGGSVFDTAVCLCAAWQQVLLLETLLQQGSAVQRCPKSARPPHVLRDMYLPRRPLIKCTPDCHCIGTSRAVRACLGHCGPSCNRLDSTSARTLLVLMLFSSLPARSSSWLCLRSTSPGPLPLLRGLNILHRHKQSCSCLLRALRGPSCNRLDSTSARTLLVLMLFSSLPACSSSRLCLRSTSPGPLPLLRGIENLRSKPRTRLHRMVRGSHVLPAWEC